MSETGDEGKRRKSAGEEGTVTGKKARMVGSSSYSVVIIRADDAVKQV